MRDAFLFVLAVREQQRLSQRAGRKLKLTLGFNQPFRNQSASIRSDPAHRLYRALLCERHGER